ncbi:hypothetical protein NA56DRAFT_703118 [Hyaloscypha hepaticicola]|uniref:Uncharacterized protein n=1 Tax=Hyaloscypha hepaticicola TaxID=2082293 RepID=A0A2J6Q781_9HELO|nr:hypothetical protein NA56DRAFT_703118 [Hyaloscypha hepaticicola]
MEVAAKEEERIEDLQQLDFSFLGPSLSPMAGIQPVGLRRRNVKAQSSLDPLPWNYQLNLCPLPAASPVDTGISASYYHRMQRNGDNGDGSTTERDRPVCTASLHNRVACDGCLYVLYEADTALCDHRAAVEVFEMLQSQISSSLQSISASQSGVFLIVRACWAASASTPLCRNGSIAG